MFSQNYIKNPTTAEHYAYNIITKYNLTFKVQTAIEAMLTRLWEHYEVPLAIAAPMIDGIFYQQKHVKRFIEPENT
jgi:hypothetical protein